MACVIYTRPLYSEDGTGRSRIMEIVERVAGFLAVTFLLGAYLWSMVSWRRERHRTASSFGADARISLDDVPWGDGGGGGDGGGN
jgi:hypothetical protein